jgi:hypothetical protein
LAGVPGAVLLSGVMGLFAVYPLRSKLVTTKKGDLVSRSLLGVFTFGGLIFICILAALNFGSSSLLGMTLSPYKGLAQALRTPDSETIFSRWNAISRVDVVQSAGIHQLPGLSYGYQGVIPTQLGLSLDAESLQPITLIHPDEFEASAYMPERLAFDLRPKAKTMVIEPAGGLGVLQSLAGGSDDVTVVMENNLEQISVHNAAPEMDVYMDPRVHTVFETSRVFLKRRDEQVDILYFPLTDAYRPVSSGAFSLAENFNLTVEAFQDALQHLSSGGILVATRWVQIPPSESLRLITTLVEAMEGFTSDDPGNSLILYRSIQTMTALVKPSGWTSAELQEVRTFTEDHKFDLVWTPDLLESEVNRFNQLPEPLYYQSVQEVLTTPDRSIFYNSYPFDVIPPSDDHPFFYHFFKWEQTPEVLATVGHIWQPFGGSGYLILFALLFLTIILSVLLIVLPIFILPRKHKVKISTSNQWKILIYFTLLGFAFLFVEIPLIQKTILLLGHPTYAFTVVVFTILVFSGLGSSLARRDGIPRRKMMGLLVLVAFFVPAFYPILVEIALGWSITLRVLMASLPLAPMAILMGLPFPFGLIAVEKSTPGIVPWIWAVNGSISVVASVVAAVLALSLGFTVVLTIGAIMYAAATLLYNFGFNLKPANV